MTLEQLALFGIVVFAVMALGAAFNAFRTIKRIVRRPDKNRYRRIVSGSEAAQYVATSIVNEVIQTQKGPVAESRTEGRPTKKLQQALEKAETYFLTRVESRHRPLFSRTVETLIFEKSDD